ncbi:unnamed protein product, partial [marine sediment metagenome]
VGHHPKDNERVLIIDDVITDGGALIESMDILTKIANLKYSGVMLSVNRREKTKQGKNAVWNFEKKYCMPIRFIVTVREIMDCLHNNQINGQVYITDKIHNKMEEYLKTYGV